MRTSTRVSSLAGEVVLRYTRHGTSNAKNRQISKQMRLECTCSNLCKEYLPLYMQIALMHKVPDPGKKLKASTHQDKRPR